MTYREKYMKKYEQMRQSKILCYKLLQFFKKLLNLHYMF